MTPLRKLKESWQNQETDMLIRAILLLRERDEVNRFLRDLLTEAEIIEFGHRFKAARMLAKGFHYNAIAEDTGLSSTTIARVQKWLRCGMGGYRVALKRLDKHHL